MTQPARLPLALAVLALAAVGLGSALVGWWSAGFESGGVWKNNLTDLIGSPIKWVDTAGNESVAVHYDPYGVPRAGAVLTRGIGYAGEYGDPTGLTNLRARSYHPVMGRFIGRDTFAGFMSAPQTGNRYAYALTKPVRYTCRLRRRSSPRDRLEKGLAEEDRPLDLRPPARSGSELGPGGNFLRGAPDRAMGPGHRHPRLTVGRRVRASVRHDVPACLGSDPVHRTNVTWLEAQDRASPG